jgi:hypothetical protein
VTCVDVVREGNRMVAGYLSGRTKAPGVEKRTHRGVAVCPSEVAGRLASGHAELVGLVVVLDGHLTQLGIVRLRVVAAEQQIPATWQHDPHVGLGTASVATIEVG